MREEAKLGGAWTLAIVVAMVVALGLAAMWVFGFGLFTDATANRQGETEKKQQVEGDGSYRIAQYDHFFDLCAGVQSTEDKIAAQRAELASHPDAQRGAILRINITALTGSRADDIRTYNGDARKSYTGGQFRSSDLPYQLDIHAKETSCEA